MQQCTKCKLFSETFFIKDGLCTNCRGYTERYKCPKCKVRYPKIGEECSCTPEEIPEIQEEQKSRDKFWKTHLATEYPELEEYMDHLEVIWHYYFYCAEHYNKETLEEAKRHLDHHLNRHCISHEIASSFCCLYHDMYGC